jgi:predicted ABC-type ATPase
VSRVAERVSLGGHDIPVEIVRRRYRAGLQNLFRLYMPLADSWQFIDNSESTGPLRIAAGEGKSICELGNAQAWRTLEELYGV